VLTNLVRAALRGGEPSLEVRELGGEREGDGHVSARLADQHFPHLYRGTSLIRKRPPP